jgi:hypothetical protein
MFRTGRVLVLMLMVGLMAGLIGGCSHAGPSTAPSGLAQSPVASSGASQGQAGAWSEYETFANYAAQHGTVVYQATYQPNAVVFDEQATERALKAITPDGATYTLDAASPLAGQLKPGSVLFLYGIAIRKVTAVQTQGTNVVASTSDADITDLIKDGHIEWQVPIDLSGGSADQPSPQGQNQGFEDLFASPALADPAKYGGPRSFSFGGTADKFKCELEFGYGGGRLDVNIHATYTGSDAFMELHGTGWVQNLVAIGSIDIKHGLIEGMKTAVQGVQGHVDFDWSGIRANSGTISILDRDYKIKLPGASFKYPLILSGLPFVFEVSAAMIVHPAFTAKNSTTSGYFSADYNGTAGLTTSSGTSSPLGAVHGNESIGHETSIHSLSAMGFVAALELPRFELALALMLPSDLVKMGTTLPETLKLNSIAKILKVPGIDKITAENIEKLMQPVKPYAYVNAVIATGTFTNGTMTSSLVALPPCQRAQVVLSLNAGVGAKLNFLNPTLKKMQTTSGLKAEFSSSLPIVKKSFTAWKDHIKCPGD